MLSSRKIQTLLIATIAVVACLQTAEAGRKLHVVIAADVSDASIGRYCQTDANKVRLLFQNNVHNGEVEIHEVATANVNQAGITRTLQNAGVRPEDAVVFYYSGHGNYARDGQHYMVVGGNWTSRSSVIASLKSRGAGLAVLITDSCFNFNDVTPPQQTVRAEMRKSATAPLFRKLFFETNGFIDINSCQRDEKAATHADYSLGSVFTKAFVDSLGAKSTMATETWQSIVNDVSQETSRQFGLLHPDGETLETGDGNFVNQRSQTVAKLAMNVFAHDPGPGTGPGPAGNMPIESYEFEFNINPRTGRTTEQRTKYVFYPNTGETRTFPGPMKSLGKASLVKASDSTRYWRWPRVQNPDVVNMEPVYVQAILPDSGSTPGDDRPPAGMITNARLGVMVKNHSGSGVMIRRVDVGSPATRCLGSDGNTWRLEAGDRITQINGQQIRNTRDFTRTVRNSPSMMAIVVQGKDGSRHQMTATLNADTGPPVPTPVPTPGKGPRLGITVSTMPGMGVVVTSVVPGTPATRCRYNGKTYQLEAGDLITRVNGMKITSEASFARAVRSSGRSMSLRVKDIAKNKKYDFTTKLNY